MANRERPQPFRFWLPFYSRHAPTPPPPPSTRRQARSPTPPASPRASPALGTQPRPSSQGQSATPPASSSASPSASPAVGAQPQYSPKEQSPTPPPAPSASPVEAAAQPQHSPQEQPPTPASPLGSSSTSPGVAVQPQRSSQEQAPSPPTSLGSPSASPKVGPQPPYSSQAQPPIPPPSQAQPPNPPPSQPAPTVVVAQSDLANSEGQRKDVKSLEDNVVNSTPVDFQNTYKEIERETKANLDREQESKTVQTPAIEKQSGQVSEEFKTNGEAKQKAPVETQDPNILSEGFDKDRQEIEAPKPETSNQPTETIETKASTPEPHIEFPSEGSKLKVELQISPPKHSEKGDKSNIEKLGIKNGSRGKETKIAISSIPRASIFDGQRACFQKEIEDGLGKLYQKQIDGISQKPGFGHAVSIITLQESSCSAHNPGVHLNLTSKQTEDLSQLGRIEPPKAKETNLNVKPDTKISHDPRVRRRCLRALFLESESDPENPQKPRRHGCRFSCEGERKKGHEDGIRLANSESKHAEEGSSRTFNQ